MRCPLCDIPLLIVELDKVEADWCAQCGGVWLDRGELELLLDDSRPDMVQPLAPDSTTSHSDADPVRNCPKCGERMSRAAYPGQEPIIIDECPGHGLWFDSGELQELLRKAGNGPMPEFLRRVFVQPATSGEES